MTNYQKRILFIVSLLILTAFIGKTGAQEPKHQPTVEQLQAEVTAKNARIKWLTNLLKQTQAKLDALAAYFAADEAIMRLQANPPVEEKK